MIYLMNVTIGQCSDRTFANRRPAFLFFLVECQVRDSQLFRDHEIFSERDRRKANRQLYIILFF